MKWFVSSLPFFSFMLDSLRHWSLSLAQGLGKTVQTIALLMARRSHDPEIKTNLIVLPLSLLSQWEDEIEKFAIGQSVHIYHGSNKYKAKSKEELQKFDVVLTTHSTLSLE
jgi:SNF2 family DNA or RNA helicase